MAKVTLFEDIMQVAEVDPDGKRFDKGARRRAAGEADRLTATPPLPVSRLRCKGDHSDAECTVDINVEIYPMKA